MMGYTGQVRRSCTFALRGVAVLRVLTLWGGMAGVAAGARGQPATYTELGDISESGSVLSADVPLANFEVKWFHMRLTHSITPLRNWIDIDTGPSTINNNMVAIYDARGNFLGWDNDSGGGTTSWAAAMSFGGGSGEFLSSTTQSPERGRVSDGAWGHTLPAGDYYLAVCGYTATFPFPDPILNWNLVTNSTDAGTLRVRIATGIVPGSTWNERFHGYDGGEVPSTARAVIGEGPVTRIITAFSPGSRDTFKIHIDNPLTFRVVANPTLGWGGPTSGGLYGARVFLIDEANRGVCAINGTVAGTTTLTGLPGLAAGDYYLVVSSNCGGTNGQSAVPYDSAGLILWDFAANGNNVVIRPNPNAGPMVYFGRQSDCVTNSDAYYVRLDLTGVAYLPESDFCPSDFNHDGAVDFFDYLDFVQAFSRGC